MLYICGDLVILKTYIVPDTLQDEVRIYDFATKVFPSIPSRKGIKKAIKRGEILIDGQKTTTGAWIKPHQKIEWVDLETKPPKTYALKLEVVYEDEHLAVINKPAGIEVSGNKFRTIQNTLLNNLQVSTCHDAMKWPKPVHRLDYATSGLLVVAKTSSAIARLGRQFEVKSVKKTYHAIAIGKIEMPDTISQPIDNKEAKTELKPLSHVRSLKNDWLTKLELRPHTGRRHQLRKHLLHYGFPILGDQKYGYEGLKLKSKGLFLCAVQLIFDHPATGTPLKIAIKEPPKFVSLMKREQRRWETYNPPVSKPI